MTVTISDSEYSKVKDQKPQVVNREYTSEGVVKSIIGYAGGIVGWYNRTVEWGEKTDVKQCPQCDRFHNKYNPPLCFSCATGRT